MLHYITFHILWLFVLPYEIFTNNVFDDKNKEYVNITNDKKFNKFENITNNDSCEKRMQYANSSIDDKHGNKQTKEYTNITNDEGQSSEYKEYLEEREILKNVTADWTGCEEFLANTTFDINSVLDIDWQIFYFWAFHYEMAYNIRFSLATEILIDRFMVEFKNTELSVNWSNAVLFMETSIDFSALYIKTETSGKFRLLPGLALRMNHIPKLIFGLKVVEPGYLGIMNCEHRLAYALAPVDKMPENKDLIHAAEKIGFRGNNNHSYLTEYESLKARENPNEDDAEEDEEFEIENEIDEL